MQNPSFFGHVRDFTELAEACHAAGALLIVVVTEVVSLGLLKPPGEMGADIVVCEGQSIGNGLGFGGPYVGLFATRDKYVRQMPGRLVGETVDADGKRGFVLTLSTARAAYPPREGDLQHLHQRRPLRARLHRPSDACWARRASRAWPSSTTPRRSSLPTGSPRVPGVKVLNDSFFNEFTVRLPKPAAPVVEALADQAHPGAACRCRGCIPDDPSVANLLLLAATETATDARHGRR